MRQPPTGLSPKQPIHSPESPISQRSISPNTSTILSQINQLPERPTFILDDPVEDDSGAEDITEDHQINDEEVLNEVEAFLQANGGESNDVTTLAAEDAKSELVILPPLTSY